MLILTDGQPRGLGYLEVDQRPVEAALPPGTSRYFEADTYTCSHCHSVVVMNPERKRERYKCNGCNHHICDDCAAKKFAGQPCKTLWQQADEILARAARQPNPPTSPAVNGD
jgi:hypothetical protein